MKVKPQDVCSFFSANRIYDTPAFSLIELVVGVAVIGVLAALTLVGVASAQRSMRQAQNVASLRVLGHGSIAYATDNQGKFPLTTYDIAGTMPRYTSGMDANAGAGARRLLSAQWKGGLGTTDYVPSPDAFYGPYTTFISKARKPREFYEPAAGSGVYRLGYVFYSLLAAVDAQGREPFGYNLANDRIGNGSIRTPLYSDMIGDLMAQTGFNGDKCTVVYVDGSVSSFLKEKIDKAGSTNARILTMAGQR